ncbi:MAG: DUF4157 domain-containing protein [Bacteroidota bacterium]
MKTHNHKLRESCEGLPTDLQMQLEYLSGYSMRDVSVCYNSSRPAEVQAHAYAQGSAIYLAPGQEKYLPHEAWHVVQQKQGRVSPNRKITKTTFINDDRSLEIEADLLGMAVSQAHFTQPSLNDDNGLTPNQWATIIPENDNAENGSVIQRALSKAATLLDVDVNTQTNISSNDSITRFDSVFEDFDEEEDNADITKRLLLSAVSLKKAVDKGDASAKEVASLIKQTKVYFAVPDAGRLEYLNRLEQLAVAAKKAKVGTFIKSSIKKKTETAIDKLMESIGTERQSIRNNPQLLSVQQNVFGNVNVAKDKVKTSTFDDLKNYQFRISGTSPVKVEQVERRVSDSGEVTYFAVGELINFNGKTYRPQIVRYNEARALPGWYPKVTQMNGMNIKPTTGLRDATLLQQAINAEVGGDQPMDVLYTYSPKRSKDNLSTLGMWRSDNQNRAIQNPETAIQTDLMLDAIKRKDRIIMGAHSRGTIITNNAVKIVFDRLMREKRAKSKKEYVMEEQVKEIGPFGEPDDSEYQRFVNRAEARMSKEVTDQMKQYLSLEYAGNAISRLAPYVPVRLYVGDEDQVTRTREEFDNAQRGTSGISNSELAKSVNPDNEVINIQGKHSYTYYAGRMAFGVKTDLRDEPHKKQNPAAVNQNVPNNALPANNPQLQNDDSKDSLEDSTDSSSDLIDQLPADSTNLQSNQLSSSIQRAVTTPVFGSNDSADDINPKKKKKKRKGK